MKKKKEDVFLRSRKRLEWMKKTHKLFPNVPVGEISGSWEYLSHSEEIHSALVGRKL